MTAPSSEQIQRANAIADKECPYPRNEAWQVGGMAAFLQWLILYVYGELVGLASARAAWTTVELAAAAGLIFFLDTRQKERRHLRTQAEALRRIMGSPPA